MCLCVCVHVHTSAGASRLQKKSSDLQELELQAILMCPVWVLGSELRSSTRTASMFNC